MRNEGVGETLEVLGNHFLSSDLVLTVVCFILNLAQNLALKLALSLLKIG